MGMYDTQQVCLNGHQITSHYHEHPENRKIFCSHCGEQTIFSCPTCNTEIQGYYNIKGVFPMGPTPVPSHCRQCGHAYPWTERNQSLAKALESAAPTDGLRFIEQICSRFHLVAKQLRSRHDGRSTLDIADEYDVQDLMHALLQVYFDDIRAEEWTPSYAGKCSRMDFLLKNESMVLEIKKTRKGLGIKELRTQLFEDIEQYKSHPTCKILICFIYDPEGHIPNPKGIENDLNRTEPTLTVKVIIVPKGY